MLFWWVITMAKAISIEKAVKTADGESKKICRITGKRSPAIRELADT
jgi:hypothetical protein